MLHVPKIDDYLKLLNWWQGKWFEAINVSEYFNSVRKGQNLRKVAKLLCISVTTPEEVEKYMQPNSSDNYIHRYCCSQTNW